MPLPTSYTIDKVAWHTQTPGNTESVEHIHKRFRAVIHFLQEKQLTRRVILSVDAPVTDDVSIHTDDLTEPGLTLMKACYNRWLRRVDRGLDPEDLRIFEKFLAQ